MPCAHAPKPLCCCRLRAWGAPWGRPSFGLSRARLPPGARDPGSSSSGTLPRSGRRRRYRRRASSSTFSPSRVVQSVPERSRPPRRCCGGRRACLIDSLTRLGLILGRRSLCARIYLGLLPGRLSRPSLARTSGYRSLRRVTGLNARGHCSRAVTARFASWFQSPARLGCFGQPLAPPCSAASPAACREPLTCFRLGPVLMQPSPSLREPRFFASPSHSRFFSVRLLTAPPVCTSEFPIEGVQLRSCTHGNYLIHCRQTFRRLRRTVLRLCLS